MKIFELFGDVTLKDGGVPKTLDDIEKKAGGVGKTLSTVGKTVVAAGAAIGAGVSAAGGAMVGLATKAGNAADRLLDLSDITGMTTDEIQRWEKVTKVAGVSADAITGASQKLTKSLDTMASGTGKGAEALHKLGLTYDQVANMTADERMNVLTAALGEVEDKTERARIGTDLFGGSWKDIAPIVGMGAEAMAEVKANANIFSEEDLQRANEFRISMDLMKDRVSFLAMELGIKLIPIAEKFFDWVDTYMPDIQKAFDVAFTVIGTVVNTAVDIIDTYLLPMLQFVFNWVEEHLPEIQEFFQTVFKAMAEIIKGFVDIALAYWNAFGDDIIKIWKITFDTVKTVIESALKIIQGIVNVFVGLFTGDWQRFGDGLKQIWQGLWSAIEAIVRGAWGILGTALSSLYTNIRGWFTGLVSDAVSWGRDIMSGLARGIADMAMAPINAAKNVASNIGDSVKGFFKISSPSKLMEEYGKNITEGLGIGMEKIDLKKSTTALMETVPSTVATTPVTTQIPGGSINNHFNIANMTVRDDMDIKKIARELYNLQRNAGRGMGMS